MPQTLNDSHITRLGVHSDDEDKDRGEPNIGGERPCASTKVKDIDGIDLEMGCDVACDRSHAVEGSATTESSSTASSASNSSADSVDSGTEVTHFDGLTTGDSPSSSAASSSAASSSAASSEAPTGAMDYDVPESLHSVISLGINEDCDTIWVPPPGEPLEVLEGGDLGTCKSSARARPYSNACSICLSPFDTSDVVSWSHCLECPHVFHTECILGWLNMTGRKYMQKRYDRRQRNGNYVLRQDPITTITRIPMLCPCCRRPFIKEDADTVPVAVEAAVEETPRRDVVEAASESSSDPRAEEDVEAMESGVNTSTSTEMSSSSTRPTTDSTFVEEVTGRQRAAEVMVSTV